MFSARIMGTGEVECLKMLSACMPIPMFSEVLWHAVSCQCWQNMEPAASGVWWVAVTAPQRGFRARQRLSLRPETTGVICRFLSGNVLATRLRSLLCAACVGQQRRRQASTVVMSSGARLHARGAVWEWRSGSAPEVPRRQNRWFQAVGRGGSGWCAVVLATS